MPINLPNFPNLPSSVTAELGLTQATGKDNKKIPVANIFVMIDPDGGTPGANGGQTFYALLEGHSFDEAFKDERIPIGGTNVQVIGVGAYSGDGTLDLIFTTDLPNNEMAIVYGDLPTYTVRMVGLDSQSSPVTRTYTLSNVRFFKRSDTRAKDALYRRKWTIIWPAQGTWS